jgi:hypothetical protein
MDQVHQSILKARVGHQSQSNRYETEKDIFLEIENDQSTWSNWRIVWPFSKDSHSLQK